MRAGDRTSMNCINPKCGRKNENIEYIVLAMADNRINKENKMDFNKIQHSASLFDQKPKFFSIRPLALAFTFVQDH